MPSVNLASPCLTCCLLFLLPTSTVQFMTECDRGVTRPHPTQENAFQIFVRSNHNSQWLDQQCPAPKVFNGVKCECVDPPTEAPPPPSPPPRPVVNSKRKKSPWFSRSKPIKLRGTERVTRPSPKPAQRKIPQTPPPSPRHRLRQKESTSPWEGPKQNDAPVTVVKECFHHRSKEGGGVGQYEQWTEGGWILMDCNWPVNSGLVWSQKLCRCDWGSNRILAQPDLSQVPAVCLMMLKMTFDDGEIKDTGRDLWLDFHNPFNMEAVRDATAVGGWAGAFRGAGIAVPFFKMNTLGSTFRIKFRFRLCEGHPDADLMLINNGCVESDALPSLQVSYREWTDVLAFQMATMNSLGPIREECHIDSQSEWFDVNIHYDQDILDVRVNGEQCVHSSAYSGPIVQTDCPFILLEDNFCGLLDEVVITRGCTPMQES